jgi:8-oxo-dGTP pyrophosphatase MutT (NUDIX family)
MNAPGPIARECIEAYLFSGAPPQLLLFRRPPARGSIWVPVSGKVEPTDADFVAAVRREVAEETGARELRRVIELDWHVPFRVDNGETWRLHAYAVEIDPGFVPTLSSEHDAAEWVRPDEARRRLHYEDNRAAVDRLLDRLSSSPRND